jgi:cell division protein FtsN
MSEQPDAVQPASDDDQAEQRSALLRRLVVAGGLIALLIGALAVFDASRRPVAPAPAEAPGLSAQAPAPTQDIAAQEAATPPVIDDVGLPPLPPPAEDEAGAAQVKMEDTPLPPLPPAEAAPAAGGSAGARPAATRAAPPLAEETARPEMAPLPEDARPPARPEPPAPRPAAAASAYSRSAAPESGYVVQVGVFSSLANAQDMQARLTREGIPTRIEARVHVGPFRTRAEADRARQRLRAIGLDSAPPAVLKGGLPER